MKCIEDNHTQRLNTKKNKKYTTSVKKQKPHDQRKSGPK